MPAEQPAAPPLTPADLAQRVRVARAVLDITQRELAQRAGVAPSSVIGPLEAARPHNWHPVTLARVALALGHPWDYLGAAPPPDIPPDSPGYRLCVARLTRAWTTQELSDASGIRKDTILHLEHGRYRGQVDTWHALARALGVTMNDLIPISP